MSEKATPSSPVSRRNFVKGSAALAAAFTIVKPQSVRGSQANSMVEVGWVGCGGQGTRDAELLEATKGAKIVAVADYFQDQADKARAKFQVDAKRTHVGLDSYKAVIGSDVDAVLLVTPPGFRPEHFRAAVNAKKHVFAEKPLAVDVAGRHSVAADGEKAKAQKLSVVVGLQRHYSKAYRKCRIIDFGALGDVIMSTAWTRTRLAIPSWQASDWRRMD